MKNKKILGNIILILVASIWGTAFVFQRVGMDSIEPMTFNAARMTLAPIAIGMVTMFRRRRSTPDKTGEKERGKRQLLSAVSAAEHFLRWEVCFSRWAWYILLPGRQVSSQHCTS